MHGILTLNAGSSSLRFGLYRGGAEPQMVVDGHVDGIGPAARLTVLRGERREVSEVAADTPGAALDAVMMALEPDLSEVAVNAVGHRIVHGGTEFNGPVLLKPDTIAALEALVPLAPLHQPHNLAGVEVARRRFPAALQIGCFDTSFHRTHPWVNDTFALPRKFYDSGVRRYGFHGLSYEYITGEISRLYPALSRGRVVIAHLGNGASMCAVNGGQSVGSTMGFTALDGLPMGTRCGQVDPGVVLHLLTQVGMSAEEVTHLLYRESGLLGLSGLSSDMRVLLASDAPEAAQAIDYYVFRARREIGAMTAVLGGIDALVFCGGIGENAAPVRQRIVDGLEYLDIALDQDANRANAPDIGAGKTRVMVMPTDEERVIARAAQIALDKARDLAV
ncbi:MAG: acetate/propionate family kinase [Pseudomonadota bacterium]